MLTSASTPLASRMAVQPSGKLFESERRAPAASADEGSTARCTISTSSFRPPALRMVTRLDKLSTARSRSVVAVIACTSTVPERSSFTSGAMPPDSRTASRCTLASLASDSTNERMTPSALFSPPRLVPSDTRAEAAAGADAGADEDPSGTAAADVAAELCCACPPAVATGCGGVVVGGGAAAALASAAPTAAEPAGGRIGGGVASTAAVAAGSDAEAVSMCEGPKTT